jgi:hypothetical protein
MTNSDAYPQIDPPMGWQYGFPKPIPQGVEPVEFLARLDDWLVENGYPQGLIDQLGGSVASDCRIIGDWPL